MESRNININIPRFHPTFDTGKMNLNLRMFTDENDLIMNSSKYYIQYYQYISTMPISKYHEAMHLLQCQTNSRVSMGYPFSIISTTHGIPHINPMHPDPATRLLLVSFPPFSPSPQAINETPITTPRTLSSPPSTPISPLKPRRRHRSRIPIFSIRRILRRYPFFPSVPIGLAPKPPEALTIPLAIPIPVLLAPIFGGLT